MKVHPSRTLFALALSLAACSSGPPMQPAPEPVVPPQYKNAAPVAEGSLTRKWWVMYGDPLLSEYIETTLRDNPYTEIGLMRVAQALAQVQSVEAGGRLQVNADIGVKNSHSSQTTPLGKLLGGQSISGNEGAIGLGASWQVDLWNRVARAVDAANARADVARTFARNIELVLSTEVAVAYWQYRAADADLALLTKERAQRSELVDLLALRVQADLGEEGPLAHARVDLGKVDSDIIEARRKRTLAENELATLVVKPLKDFSVPPDTTYRMPEIPTVAPGLPAEILSRRPDLAESTQTLRELLAQEAIAETAFYPTLTLTGNFGFASEQLKDLLQYDSRSFSIGPLALTVPIFDGGRNQANLDIARARYREAADMHRSKLLIALREVDDALVEIQSSREQMQVRSGTLRASKRVVAVASSRYEEGDASYLRVTEAESEALQVERDLMRSRAEGLLATVRLVGALGGGWSPQ